MFFSSCFNVQKRQVPFAVTKKRKISSLFASEQNYCSPIVIEVSTRLYIIYMHIISLHAYHIITCKKEKKASNLGPFNILDFPGVWEYRSNIFFALFFNYLLAHRTYLPSCGVSCEILEKLRSPKYPIFRRRNWRSRGFKILFRI